ncbi:MAG: hypothetical protein A2X13_04235 [Bacteroidetes bacterium GWC2_33_15]|nr:MAG: hypothetical protein A2X10_01000 [Bacteroidetes bacterium GWA2_33_15]OFX49729.1 MAG: hypothetical protein A2X13_04235 [Bacteroidetes bacterium GWC2_33_15]OFX65881.1 MAG: hypothetical protein A2X15_10600 [Bacteroidetes bacterium GWB2_32_14]OFX68358.1 MAG: hypothetical protein A2X14_08295 [Bacteroidetes bacterium GWD2_33_33]HAN18146.1 flavodoxin [Bacteroidales bacterium]
MDTAIIYATKHGCTEKCSQTLANELPANTQLFNLETSDIINIDNYEVIILGGSIHAGMVNKTLKKYIEKNLALLSDKKIGLFLCCMEENDKAIEQFNNAFPEKLRNRATAKGFFGGEFNFEKMNFIEKAIIKKIAHIEDSMSKINYQNIKTFATEMIK